MPARTFEQRFPVMDMERDASRLERYLRKEAKEDLRRFGAVLIRNTGIDDTRTLEDNARLFMDKLYEVYLGGTVPRGNRSRHVFDSTGLNRLFKIKLHNELAYQANHPRYISFFCETAARVGGETPVAHESDVLDALGARYVARVDDDDIVYTRRYPSEARHPWKTKLMPSMFMSWQSAFRSGDREEVESTCAALELQHRWLPDDTLEVCSVLPAFRTIPENGRRVHFNQLLTHNYSVGALGLAAFAVHKLAGVRRSNAPRDSRLERAGRPSRADLAGMNSAFDQAKVQFRWREGDWLLLDNLQAMHARNRYAGSRSVWVVMGE